MKFNKTDVQAKLLNGNAVRAYSSEAFAMVNSNIFKYEPGDHHEWDWAAIGLSPFAEVGKKRAMWLLADDVDRVFTELPDGFTMPKVGEKREGNRAKYGAEQDTREEDRKMLRECHAMLKVLVANLPEVFVDGRAASDAAQDKEVAK